MENGESFFSSSHSIIPATSAPNNGVVMFSLQRGPSPPSTRQMLCPEVVEVDSPTAPTKPWRGRMLLQERHEEASEKDQMLSNREGEDPFPSFINLEKIFFH